MRFPFLELPAERLTLRPVVPIVVEGLPDAPQLCLVDSGSLRNRFGAWVAEAAGISLEGAPGETVGIGGGTTVARVARVKLSLGETTFEAPVSFCDPWPFSFNLLGQEGFFRYFRVAIAAAEDWLECTAEPVPE